jgi:prepilin-type N-terminal cleavage/methylation domain-containing protein
MFTKLKKSQGEAEKGFTIIEVMIVLAIAGLILLIVFLAVPALQRNSRNTQRKSAASQVLTSVSNYVSNNNGTIPNTQALLDTARSDYRPGFYVVANIFYHANTAIDTSAAAAGSESATNLTTEDIIYYNGAICNGNTATATGASPRSYAVTYAIESGGGPVPQCIDN